MIAKKQLHLKDAIAMAVGGMVGGGIFAVLGKAVQQAGNAAFLAFGLAGLLALLTGLSYSRLMLSFDEPGGSFTFIEHVAGAGVSGTVSWFLLLGYAFTISLYAHTFGAYGARLAGLQGTTWVQGAGALIIALLAAVNLMGVRGSALTEDLLVGGKTFILVAAAIMGFMALDPAQAFPVFETRPVGIVSAAALIFVAYEGFQLLTYDYDDIVEPRKTLPRAIWMSIVLVIGLYVVLSFVTTGVLDDATIAGEGETVLALVARPVLGRASVAVILAAAVMSTASAINATLFATARLARRIARDKQLPSFVTRWEMGGVPAGFLLGTAAAAGLLQWFGSLEEIATFASLVFLLVFAAVNAAALAHRVFAGAARVIPALGGLGCILSAGVLLMDTGRNDPGTLLVIGIVAACVLVARLLFTLLHHEFRERSGGSI